MTCIYNVTSGSHNYLTLLNNDDVTDNNVTYQYVCLVSFGFIVLSADDVI